MIQYSWTPHLTGPLSILWMSLNASLNVNKMQSANSFRYFSLGLLIFINKSFIEHFIELYLNISILELISLLSYYKLPKSMKNWITHATWKLIVASQILQVNFWAYLDQNTVSKLWVWNQFIKNIMHLISIAIFYNKFYHYYITNIS